MFFSLRNLILKNVDISDRNSILEIVKALLKDTRFCIFLILVIILSVITLVIGFLRFNKNVSEFIIYVVAVILLYELFILKRIYKANNYDEKSLSKNNFKDYFTEFLVPKNLKDVLKEESKDEESNIDDSKEIIKNESEERENNLNDKSVNNKENISENTKEDSKKDKIKEKEDNKNKNDNELTNNRKNHQSKENNKKEKTKDSITAEDNKKSENDKIIIVDEKDRKKEDKGSIIFIEKENKDKKEKNTKEPEKKIKKDNSKKKVNDLLDGIPKKDDKKENKESKIDDKENKLNEKEQEIFNKITDDPEKKENIEIVKIKVEEKKQQEKEIKPQKREIKLNKSEGDIYLGKIKQNVNLKNEAFKEISQLREKLDSARSHAITMVKEFRTNFFNLIAVSEKIEHILLSIGIPLSIEKYELEELENEINNKYSLEETGLEIVKNEVKNKEGHKKLKFTLSNDTPKEKIIDTLENIKAKIKINDDPINIEQNLSNIENLLVLEALITLIFLIILIFNFTEYFKYFKFIILLILILNVFLGIYTLVMSELLNKKCITKEKEGCKQNVNKINELVMLLNKNADFEDDQIELIKNEFDKITVQSEKNIEVLENYLRNIFKSKLGVKIFIFENLIDKLRFIEGDFEELTKNSVDKKLFYTNVDLLARSLEKIKHFINNTNTYKVIDVYKDLVVVNSFFKNEKESVNENVKRIVRLDLQKENKTKTKKCETFIQKICNLSKIIDEISFILIFCSFLLSFLILI